MTSDLEKSVWFYIHAQLNSELQFKITLKEVSKLFPGHSESSIRRGVKAVKEGRDIGKHGSPRFLTDWQEDILLGEILLREEVGNCMTVEEIRQSAELVKIQKPTNPDVENRPNVVSITRSFVRKLMTRHDLSMKRPSPLDAARYVVSVEAIQTFWSRLEDLVSEYQYTAKHVYNMDETQVSQARSNGRIHVVCRPKSPLVLRKSTNPIQHITAAVTISADGKLLPTMIILPRKTIPREVAEEAENLEFGYASSPTGWMNRRCFESWTKKIFIPEVVKRRDTPYTRSLLILDGHSSRISVPAIEMLREALIDVAILPSHSSHISQPLDVGCFSSFKHRLGGRNLNSPLLVLLRALRSALQGSMTLDTCKRAFEAAGIWPLDVSQPLSHPQFQLKLEPSTPRKQTRCKTIVIGSTIFTSDEQLNLIRTNCSMVSELPITSSSSTRARDDCSSNGNYPTTPQPEDCPTSSELRRGRSTRIGGRILRSLKRRSSASHPRKRGPRLCSICGKPGHYSPRCSLK